MISKLQTAEIGNVGRQIGAVHALHAGLHFKLLDLLIGDVGKGQRHQVDLFFQRIRTQGMSKVVQSAQVKVALAKVVTAQRIAHLQIKQKVRIQFFITPAKPAFEHLQPQQDVHWHIRSRGAIGIEHRKPPFLDAQEDFLSIGGSPRSFQDLQTARG